MALAIEYLPLEDVELALVNAKDHDNELTAVSFEQFGYVQAIVRDDRTGRLLAGHGRIETLLALRDSGAAPPENVELDDDGRWLVPVQVGVESRDDAHADAMALALNRVGEGLWKDDTLDRVLLDLEETRGLEGTGFDSGDLERLLNELAMRENEPPLPGSQPVPSEDLPFTFGEYQGRVSVAVYESFKAVYEGKREKGEMLDSVLRKWLGL